jgi:hypothetical protein
MPAKIVIDTGVATSAYEPARDHLQSICTRHHKALTRIVLERRNRGPASGRIPESIVAKRDAGESVEAYVESLVERTIELIQKDSVKPRGRGPSQGIIGAWSGRVVLLDETRAKKDEKELDSMLVDIEDPEAFQSIEAEHLGFIREMRATLKAYGDIMNSNARAYAKRERAVTKLVRSVAKSSSKSHRSAGRWAWKMTREQERTRREESADARKTERSAKRTEAFESIVTDYKDEVVEWSSYFREQVKRGGGLAPKKPTDEEAKKIFDADENEARRYDVEVTVDGATYTMRKLVAEIMHEKSRPKRLALAKLLKAVIKEYPDETLKVLAARAVMVVGEPRAAEILRWLQKPVTW